MMDQEWPGPYWDLTGNILWCIPIALYLNINFMSETEDWTLEVWSPDLCSFPQSVHIKKKNLFFCFLLLHVSLIGLLEIGGWVWLVRSIRTQILNLTILTTAHPLFWSCVVSLLRVSNFFFNHALYVSLSRTQLLPTVVVFPVFPGVWDSEAGR